MTKKDEVKKDSSFIDEFILRLQKAEIEFVRTKKDALKILVNAQEAVTVTAEGVIRIGKEYIDVPDVRKLCQRLWPDIEEVKEYLEFMRNAPLLKAEGLSAPYKKLADFNGYVLGGKESPYGIQFTTWQWTYGGTSLEVGHYYENDFAGAKQDFVLRSGLIEKERIFSNEQLTELYHCISDALASDTALSYEREKLLESAQRQIRELIPIDQEMRAGMSALSPNM